MTSPSAKPVRIVVSALSRRRPDMLSKLLRSFGEMTLPEGCEVSVLIVENDDTNLSEDIVRAHATLPNGLAVDYALETELGIPFGRNRAAKEAIAKDADLLAFVDDDERVDPNWLCALLRTRKDTGADLVGGPLRAELLLDKPSMFQRLMFASLNRRYRTKETRAKRKTAKGGTEGVTIVTNNWLADLAIFKEHDIWFDEAMRFTGGTDSKLYAEVRARGLKTAWSTDAFVYEEIPQDRLSFRYQFKRGRDQSSTNFHRKLARSRSAAWSVILSIPLKLLALLLLILAFPFMKGRTLLDIARTGGWIAGRIDALRGRRSDLYADVTGG